MPEPTRLERSLEAALEEAAHVNATFEALLRVAQIEGGAQAQEVRALRSSVRC